MSLDDFFGSGKGSFKSLIKDPSKELKDAIDKIIIMGDIIEVINDNMKKGIKRIKKFDDVILKIVKKSLNIGEGVLLEIYNLIKNIFGTLFKQINFLSILNSGFLFLNITSTFGLYKIISVFLSSVLTPFKTFMITLGIMILFNIFLFFLLSDFVKNIPEFIEKLKKDKFVMKEIEKFFNIVETVVKKI